MRTLETVARLQQARTGPAKQMLLKLISFPVLLGTLLMAGIFLAARIYFVEGDTWWHLVEGEDLLRTHTWPTTDSYSFTAYGNASMAFEWLGDATIAVANRLGGLAGLMALLIALGSALVLLIYYYASLRSENPKAAFVATALLLPFIVVFLRLRPQLLGFSFLVVTLICLEHFRRGRHKALWMLPGVFVLWVNTHGTFIFGLLALGLSWVSGLLSFRRGGLVAERSAVRERHHLALVTLLCVLALTATPYGSRQAGFILHVVLNAPLGMSAITEYQSLAMFGLLLRPFLVLLLVFLVAQLLFRPTYRLDELMLLLLSIYLAWTHMRLLLLFVIVLAPMLAMLLGRWIPNYEPGKDRLALNAALMAIIGSGLVMSFPSRPDLEKLATSRFPRGAVAYLKQHPIDGPMLNADQWGAYLIRSLGRQRRIFIDGRSQLYEDAGVFGDYVSMIRVESDTPFLLRKYGIKACLIETGTPLANFLSALPDWEPVYQDDLAVLFVRKHSRTVSHRDTERQRKAD